MKRNADTTTINQLASAFADLDFPEYQREPNVWSLEQKQRLVDSILRRFDISTIYFYKRLDGGLECIDGRQRINAIMAFMGMNAADERDDGFSFKPLNEIYAEDTVPFSKFDGHTFAEIKTTAEDLPGSDPEHSREAAEIVDGICEYAISVVYLSEAEKAQEFNLQFLRLNLGTLINGGEKLHAMVGNMHDLLFKSPSVGKHPLFENLSIPTRRYATEQVAAQTLIQVFNKHQANEFTRARHTDLQRFVKENASIAPDNSTIKDVERTLDALNTALGEVAGKLRNRAIVVSVVILAWNLGLAAEPDRMREYVEFISAFLDKLRYQVDMMRKFTPDPLFPYLIDFQRHVTQASVEKPAVTQRDEILSGQFRIWSRTKRLEGEVETI